VCFSLQGIIHTPSKFIDIDVKPVQQQMGTFDCGLFALAFASSLLQKTIPDAIVYDQAKMRAHFVSCLENKSIEPFPETSGNHTINVQNIFKHSVTTI
jgi:hypothetical protein